MKQNYNHVLHDVKVQNISLYPNCKFESGKGEMKGADTFVVNSFTDSLLVISEYLYHLQSKTFSPSVQSVRQTFSLPMYFLILILRVKLSRS